MVFTKTRFAYRIDLRDAKGGVLDHIANVDDHEVAVAAYEAACKKHWPGEYITLRHGRQIIEDSRKTQVASVPKGTRIKGAPREEGTPDDAS